MERKSAMPYIPAVTLLKYSPELSNPYTFAHWSLSWSLFKKKCAWLSGVFCRISFTVKSISDCIMRRMFFQGIRLDRLWLAWSAQVFLPAARRQGRGLLWCRPLHRGLSVSKKVPLLWKAKSRFYLCLTIVLPLITSQGLGSYLPGYITPSQQAGAEYLEIKEQKNIGCLTLSFN